MIYVDNARFHFRGCLMCNLFADSIEELHREAAALRIPRSGFQRGEELAHYHVSQSKRREAIKRGAIEVDCAAQVRERMEKRRA